MLWLDDDELATLTGYKQRAKQGLTRFPRNRLTPLGVVYSGPLFISGTVPPNTAESIGFGAGFATPDTDSAAQEP